MRVPGQLPADAARPASAASGTPEAGSCPAPAAACPAGFLPGAGSGGGSGVGGGCGGDAQAGLAFLASADMASVPSAAQAECLRGLERIESLHTAARAGALAAFMACGGFEDDGQGSARAWLRWQARITRGAAAGAVAWVRRLAAHPAVGEALAAGEFSASWAREICGWTGRLPAGKRGDADAVLLAAAAGGADLEDLAALAEEMFRRCAPPDSDGDGGFADRWLRLDRTFRDAGGGWAVT